MDDQEHYREPNSALKKPNTLSVEYVLLFIGVLCFLIFIWIITFFLVPMLAHSPKPVVLNNTVAVATPSPGFVLPPTWTPGPTRIIFPTVTATQAVFGVPTKMYTPRPTSLPGIPLPVLRRPLSAIDLARIMQGESPGDKVAAYMVGWVAKNRLTHPGYGDTYAIVSHGFFGYLDGVEPHPEFMEIARQVIRAREDPTQGCLYALSRTDITKLGIPPARADVAYGEWFFFRTWPLNAR